MKIEVSKHISWDEATKSQTAIRHGINNDPMSIEVVFNMQSVANHVFERVRTHFGNRPIAITSFFRCTELNHMIGGSTRSQHIKGEAIDIDADVFGFHDLTNRLIFEYIRDELTFDQLIMEYPTKYGNPAWIHVSFRREGVNRMQVLRADKKHGRTQYTRL